MSNNLLDTLEERVTPEFVGRMTSATDASAEAISRTLRVAVPLLLAAVLERANDAAAMSQIMSWLNTPAAANGLGNLGRLFASGRARSPLMDMGADFLSLILDERQSAVTEALARYAGIAAESASSVLDYAAPMVLALLGNRVRKQGLSAMGVTNLIACDRRIFNELPTALREVAGFGSRHDAADMRREEVTRARAPRSLPMVWLVPTAIGAVLIVGGLSVLLRRLVVTDEATNPARRPQVAADAPQQIGQSAQDASGRHGPFAAEAGGHLTLRLPNGVALDVPARGIENQVILFIEDPSRQPGPAVWFNFDRVAFESGSAVLQPASVEQLRNVAEILKAYPTVEVRIGGYTETTGSPQDSHALAKSRATAVANELVRLGVAADRLTAVVAAEPAAVSDDPARADHIRNRRIALSITRR